MTAPAFAPVLDADGQPITSERRPEWLAARKTGIGASDAWRLVSEPWALWAQKSGLVEEDDLGDLEFVRWGNLLEPVVLRELGERAGVIAAVSGRLYRSTVHAWALATLDGEAFTRFDDATGVVTFPVECKTGGAWFADEWADGAPPRYRLQCQWQMLVTGAPRVLLGCLLGGQRLVWSWIERDEGTIAALAEAGADMWRRVQENDPPPADGSEATSKALAKAYRTDDGDSVALPGELIEVSAELDAIKAQIKALEVREKAAENRVKAAMGGAAVGVLADGSGWTWKTQNRSGHVVRASTPRVLLRKQPKGDK